MRPSIGHDVLDCGKLVHVQDVNNLAQTALVGTPDENGIIWEPEWKDWEILDNGDLIPLRAKPE